MLTDGEEFYAIADNFTRKENKNEDSNTDEDIDGDKGAGLPKIDITTRSDDHLNEKGSKKVCYCIMRSEITV